MAILNTALAQVYIFVCLVLVDIEATGSLVTARSKALDSRHIGKGHRIDGLNLESYLVQV